jgi:two-component sensor histidine kinase
MHELQPPGTANVIELPDSLVRDHEADHRIANNLGLIISLLRLRARAIAGESGTMDRAEVGTLLEDIAARVESVARLHRMLSQSYRGALVDLGTYLRDLCTSLTGALRPDARMRVSYLMDACCKLPPDQVLTVGLLASELLTNSVKYAHPTGVPVTIEVKCRQSTNGHLLISFVDDGVGLPENFDPMNGGGLGLRMVRSFAAQLGATLRFDSSALGTCIEVEIPTPATAAG